MLIRIPNARQAKALLKSRLFAVAVLILFTLSAVAAVKFSGKTVSIVDGETRKSVYTLRQDPKEILSQAGIELAKEDEIAFTGFKSDKAEIKVFRAVEVDVTSDGETKTVKLAKGTVRDAVEKSGFTLGEHDTLNVDPNAALSKGMDIQLHSVDYVFVTEEKVIKYATKTVYSDEISKDKVVSKDGAEGLERLTYRQKTVNGEIVETELVETTTVKAPVDAEKIIGTKAAPKKASVSAAVKSAQGVKTSAAVKSVSVLNPPAPIELDASGRPVSYKKLITGKATAYSPKDGGVTATGKAVQTGYIAVNPKIIPYGTKMYIKTSDGKYIYGYASAEDTGGFVKKGKILADLFFDSYSEARAFGVRDIEIYILD